MAQGNLSVVEQTGKNNPAPDAWELCERIRNRAAFTAEMLKFHPNVPSEMEMNGVWAIMEDIAADAKAARDLIGVAGSGCRIS